MKIRADQLTPDHLGRWVTIPGRWQVETKEEVERRLANGEIWAPATVEGKRILLAEISFYLGTEAKLYVSLKSYGWNDENGPHGVDPDTFIDVETPACCNHTCCCKGRS